MLEDRGIPARGRKISNADLLTRSPCVLERKFLSIRLTN
jgi:hypothetical protein